MNEKVGIHQLATGVPGLDEVLGGGLPEFSFNLIAGGPGCGKTTLAHQILFANATQERPGLYFTVLGEPPIKMLRYQQQFTYFDLSKVNSAIRFVHLGKDLVEGGLERVLEHIAREVDDTNPQMVVVDSFRSVVRERHAAAPDSLDLQHFVQMLALRLTASSTTSFLVGEYLEQESDANPLFTVADGIFWIYQTQMRSSVIRQFQVMKIRGQEQISGLHSMRLSGEGVRIFPRRPSWPAASPPSEAAPARLQTGVAGLDEMLGGGLPAGYSMLVSGPSGSGKTVLLTQFILEGAERGERGIIALFERSRESFLRTNHQRAALMRHLDAGTIEVIELRPLDLSVDETLAQLRQAVERTGARRMGLDSLSGFELALAPAFRVEFRESLFRMVGGLTALGVTLMTTVEFTESSTELRLGPEGISFLTDCIVLQHYIRREGELRRALSVVKLSALPHSGELREYEISDEGLVIGEKLEDDGRTLAVLKRPDDSEERR